MLGAGVCVSGAGGFAVAVAVGVVVDGADEAGGGVMIGLLLGVGVMLGAAVGMGVGVGVVVGACVGACVGGAVTDGVGLGMRGGAAVRVGVGVGVGEAVAVAVAVAVGVGAGVGTRGTRSWPTTVNSPGTVPPLLPSSCAPGVWSSRIFAAHGSDGAVTFAVALTVTGPRSKPAGATTIGDASPTVSVAVSVAVDAKVAPESTTVPVAPERSDDSVTVPFLASAASVVNCRLPEWFASTRAPTFVAPSRMVASVLLTSPLRSAGTRPR